MKHKWCGPLIIIAMEGVPVPQKVDLKVGNITLAIPAGLAFPRARDVVMKDLRIVADFFFKPYHDMPQELSLFDGHGNDVLKKRRNEEAVLS